MSSKFELITDIYKQISNEVVRSPYNWQSFLSSVCHNYRLRFDEQLLVYAQRPDATAVLETVRWNNKFHRWVNRGARGIAVFSEKRNLKYYFDISDTHEARNAIPVPVWQYKAEYEADVIETLENSFGELEDKSDIYNAVMSAADNAVEDNISDYLSDLLVITKDSFLEELDDDIVSSLYKNTVKNSIAYMLFSRLGIDTSEYFSRDDFKDIVNFNTPDTLNSIGYATSDISETVLYEISKTVKSLEMENRIIADNTHSDYTKAVNKNIERSADNDRTHLQNGKRLSDTKHRYAKSEEFDLELIWADEEDIPQEQSQSDLLQSADIGQDEQASVGNRPESDSNGRNLDKTDVRAGRLDGKDESRQSDSLGAGNEQSETESSGNRDDRSGLQSVTDELPPLTDDKLVLGIIKNADDELSVSKKDIAEYFKYHSDIDDRANFIMQAYPDVYCELDVDNIRVGYKPENDGLLLWKGAYLSRTEESFFSWGIVSEIIEQLIDNGEYITADKEKDEPIQFSIFDFSDSLPQPQVEEVKSDEKTPLEIRSDLYREYLKKKAEYPDDILLYQHGDFYNIYGDDATRTHDTVTFIMTDVTMDNGETIPIYSIPKNTKCLHCHFVINSVSFADGKMMHGKEKAWFYFRHIADEVCREYNLSVIESPQRIKHSDFLTEQDNKGKPTRYNLVRDAIDEAISHSCNKQEFEHYLKKMGYKYRLSDNLKYWTVIPKGYEKPIRLYKLGDRYTNDKIMERLIENGSAVRLRPFQKNISYSVPKEIDLRCKKGSLYNRYLYYCYKLGYLPKKEKPKYNNAKLHYLLREDLMKLDKITEETRLLAKYQIDTDKQLFSFKEALENEIKNLTADRTHLRNKIRRKNIDDVTLSEAKDEISQISSKLKTLRKEIALCDDIAERSKVIEKNIEQIERNEEKFKDKEVRSNEQWR